MLVAKLSMGALAQGDNWFGGQTKNPWNPEHAARADRRRDPARRRPPASSASRIGTETRGSIISPSAVNGVVGLRPTYGRVSRYGAMALSWTMDKIGPMCRSVEDCALVFNAIYGPDGRDDTVVGCAVRVEPRRARCRSCASDTSRSEFEPRTGPGREGRGGRRAAGAARPR